MMIQLGIETLLKDQPDLLRGKKIGLLTNMTGLDSTLTSTIDLLYNEPTFHLTALFGPEHGIRGDGVEGAEIDSYTDSKTGLPVYSLYGKTRKPTKDMLANIDSIVVDLQDIGVRYYTFISTLSLVMEACMETGKEVIVLDRPNPIGGIREGNILKKELSSFIGKHSIPNRHGMTIGELALLYKYEFGLNCPLTIIPMKGWVRTMYHTETGLIWVQPSPNATGESMAVLYPGMCFIEGTNLSEGRGTTRPFEVVGAPFINSTTLANTFNNLDLLGVIARPTSFVPTYSKFKGERCFGIQLHITNKKFFQSYKSGLSVLGLIASTYPTSFRFLGEGQRCSFNLLAGTTKLQSMVLENKFDSFFDECEEECRAFERKITQYFLY